MRHVIIAGLASLVLLCSPAATPAGAAADNRVCPPLDTGKIDTTGEPHTITVTAPDGYAVGQVCVKAGSAQHGDGPEFLVADPGTTSLTFGHSSGKAVSHWSASFVPLEVPARPQPTPDLTPTPDPQPSVEVDVEAATGTAAEAPSAPAAAPVVRPPAFTG